MTKTGRPQKLNDDLQKKICDVIRAGNYIETAAAFAGIHKSTLYDWMKRGQRAKQEAEKTGKKIPKGEIKFALFSDAIEKALAESEVRDVMIIGQSAKEDWKAAAWRLERKFPKKWGRKFIYQGDERENLRLEKMQADLDRVKTETERSKYEVARLRGDDLKDYEDDGFREALGVVAEDVWNDDND